MSVSITRRDFLKGLTLAAAAGTLAACGGSSGIGGAKITFVKKKSDEGVDDFDQDETVDGYVLYQGFKVKNESNADITLEGLVDATVFQAAGGEYRLEQAIRKTASQSTSVRAQDAAGGTVTSVAVLEGASLRTLRPGKTAEVSFYAIAPASGTTLDIFYQNGKQCTLRYGSARWEDADSESSESHFTASSASASTAESASTAASEAASEVTGTIEDPGASPSGEAMASR